MDKKTTVIAVANNKGGTGKTTVSLNLASVIKKKVHLIDCDVEEPNCQLFLNGSQINNEIVNVPVPKVNEELCIECGECANFCEFNAIAFFGSYPLIFPEMCHSCGGCVEVCSQNALTEVDKPIGEVNAFQKNNITLTEGRMIVGVAMAPPLIKRVKKKIVEEEITILDAPPGTTCPVVATIKDADFVVLVTEPTPFGLNDLKLAVEMIEQFNVPYGVIINRAGIGDNKVQEYCKEENIEVLSEIPNDRLIAEAYSNGKLIVDELPRYRIKFEELLEKIKKVVLSKEVII
mgnify:CR=1 FL=1